MDPVPISAIGPLPAPLRAVCHEPTSCRMPITPKSFRFTYRKFFGATARKDLDRQFVFRYDDLRSSLESKIKHCAIAVFLVVITKIQQRRLQSFGENFLNSL